MSEIAQTEIDADDIYSQLTGTQKSAILMMLLGNYAIFTLLVFDNVTLGWVEKKSIFPKLTTTNGHFASDRHSTLLSLIVIVGRRPFFQLKDA